MARLASLHSLVLARRLGFFTALPCAPWHIPDPDLSETLFSLSLDLIREAVADPHGFDLARLRLCGDLIGFAGSRPDKFRLK